MASWICVSVSIIAVCFLNSVNGALLNVNPAEIKLGGNNPSSSLTVRCDENTAGITQLYYVEIGKSKAGSKDAGIIRIGSGSNTKPVITDTSFGSRMTVSGSFSDTQANLQFILRNLTCADGDVTYYCESSYIIGSGSSSSPGRDDKRSNVTVVSYPENIRMTDPLKGTYVNIPVLVDFTCTGRIGNNFNEDRMQDTWRWQYRTFPDGGFSPSWTDVRFSPNITYTKPTTSGNCQYQSQTTLRRTITELDHNRQYRCFAIDEQYGSANITIYTNPTSTNPPGPATGPASASPVGLIVGVVIGVLVIIVIVIVLVWFFVFRRKSGGEDYDTGEGKPDSPEMTDNVVYSTPGSRDTKPNRMKGTENHALDEPHEKNPSRPQYANDFGNRGRYNPGMDDDSRHDQSFDGDNTDSRMRSPYGSAV